jgi:hypothetical protein
VHLTIHEIEKIPIVFIIGRGRSGTSLLQTIFDAHPSVITANESVFILHLKQKYSRVKIWSEDKINEFIVDLYKDLKFLHLWNVDQTLLRNKIKLYPINEINFPILCKLVYLSVKSPFSKSKIALIVDKNPIYSFFINELIELFPNATFIHLIRDYRDNVISSRKAFGIKNIANLSHKWKILNCYIDSIKVNMENRFYTINYESLVDNAEKSIQSICTFTGIEFTLIMLNFHQTTNKIYKENATESKVLNDIVNKIHLNLLNPINTTQINKWKGELTNNEIELIDYIAGNYGVKYNYYPTTNKFKFNYLYHFFESYFISYLDLLVYKSYYKLPMSLRDFLFALSRKVHTTFGYTNKYNKVAIKYRDKKQS